MSVTTSILQPLSIRQLLGDFWNEMLEVAKTRTGVALAVPLCGPDGWQIIVEIDEQTPKSLRITDRGRTLQWLAGRGQNTEAAGFDNLLTERLATFSIQRDGWELFREVSSPLQAVDVHLFGEALVSIAHLHYLYDPASKPLNVAEKTVDRVFRDRDLVPQSNYLLSGRLERRVKVDRFIQADVPVAIQILGRRGNLTSYMEQWGFRWRDLRDAHPNLLRAMIYDPAVQDIDATAQAIGESPSVCELFAPYNEVDRLHSLLDQAGASR